MSDAILAGVFRRMLFQHYSTSGRRLTVNATITDLSDEEFDVVWATLDELAELEAAMFSLPQEPRA